MYEQWPVACSASIIVTWYPWCRRPFFPDLGTIPESTRLTLWNTITRIASRDQLRRPVPTPPGWVPRAPRAQHDIISHSGMATSVWISKDNCNPSVCCGILSSTPMDSAQIASSSNEQRRKHLCNISSRCDKGGRETYHHRGSTPSQPLARCSQYPPT
jgi:hypothetical protein